MRETSPPYPPSPEKIIARAGRHGSERRFGRYGSALVDSCAVTITLWPRTVHRTDDSLWQKEYSKRSPGHQASILH
jgi:hypothetical protein